MPNISASTIDIVNSKLRQAMAITLLVQGDPSSRAPLNEEHIENALGAVFDLLTDSHRVLNDDGKSVRSGK